MLVSVGRGKGLEGLQSIYKDTPPLHSPLRKDNLPGNTGLVLRNFAKFDSGILQVAADWILQEEEWLYVLERKKVALLDICLLIL